tara:strand:+ start:421 stop:3732 length:3312 start_codon:yes stop_codon:yes gene_type:complete
MALVSPGVQVNVIDESFYTPSAAGTVPMIFVASASNKTSSSGAGVAVGTLAANAGKPYLITSQRELGETFGDPLFYSDNNGNMIHGGELNEYGLQAAYSVLGVTNRAYVVRADLDLSKLEASATAPAGEPAAGANWFDTQVSAFGILEWNNAPVTTTGGQSFSTVARTVLVEASDIDSVTSAPKTAIGAIGDYAVDASFTDNRVFYKSTGNTAAGVAAGEWVQVGSEDWKAGLAAVRGTISNPVLSNGDSITINGTQVVLAGTTITALATDINGSGIAGITAAAVNGALEIYSTGVDVVLTRNIGGLLADSVPSSDTGALGITEGTYSAPRVAIAPHTQVPEYKLTDAAPAPSGSIWVKTTTPNGGANFSVKQYNADTQLWGTLSAPVYATVEGALRGLDASGGGANLVAGDVYIKSNINELASAVVDYKIYSRVSSGATSISSARITTQLAAAAYTFDLAETVVGSTTRVNKTVSVTTTGAITDADVVAGAINSAGFTNIVALVDASNKIVIQHKLGGDIRIADTVGFLALAGFATSGNGATANLYDAPTGDAVNDWVASNWKPMTYTASADAPASLTAAGELWYNSIVDEVDMLVHDGATWTGYRNVYPDTNAAGPIVAATEPTVQTDNVTDLVNGDIWIDTADVENYPTIYRYNPTIAATGASGWILVDKADQTTDNGVLFADARWSAAGSSSAEATIEVLLESDYLDPDAPDPALYPKGMLLWNLRRSGFNVKRFVRNYIDVTADNGRYQVIGLSGSDEDQSMTLYYPHRWVTDSGNNEDGSGTFGRHAQRKSVVQALQALVNSNQEIRDEESRQFNLMAAPGYPELIGEMITLNYDRRLTAFVIGDTPARLTPDATSLNEWASNVNLALEDNDAGAVSYDEYMAMYYPWGFTSDNAGNNVVVPPSHMALRTLVLNDQVAFPWFAPAGTRRGGVTNASASGYITSEGEFQSVALNTGQRDILYSNNINPITFISGAGLVVFGQKTRARNASALDRVNVARLVVYLRGQLELLARPYLFEPNDKITRDQVKAAADSLLLELVALRALYDFLVVCDESNNTPARIDRNELYLDIAIEPVKAIEFIYIPLRIKNTGEIAALG